MKVSIARRFLCLTILVGALVQYSSQVVTNEQYQKCALKNAAFIDRMKQDRRSFEEQDSLYDWYTNFYEEVANTCYVQLYILNQERNESFNEDLQKIFADILLKSELYRNKKNEKLDRENIVNLTTDFYNWANEYQRAVKRENERCEENLMKEERKQEIQELANGDENLYNEWDKQAEKRNRHRGQSDPIPETSPKKTRRTRIFSLGRKKN